jgi:23S rRNA (guanosine2251-2'-O)-methyltransferase
LAKRKRRPPQAAAGPGQARPPEGGYWLYGHHAVGAALANPSRRFRRLVLAARDGLPAETLALVEQRAAGGLPVETVDRLALDRLLPADSVHQGLAARVDPLPEPDLDDRLDQLAGQADATLLLLDRITDPHNVGAILRSAAAFGAAGVVLPEHGAPPQTGALAKAASGGLDRVPLVRAVNLARTLDGLKAAGYWCCGLDENAAAPLAGLDLGPRVALVLGSEGGGLRRLVRERCDYLARLPTRPDLPSLNVSNAAAIALYELARDAEPDD